MYAIKGKAGRGKSGAERRARALEKERAWEGGVPLWRCFPPRVEGNCVLATGRGEQLETKG